MFGLINLYKPAGFTSRDCVNIVSKNLATRKVGHAGTLDPIAEGVLVIAVGKATRLIEYVQRQPKTYRGSFTLGLRSESCDTETEVTTVACDPSLTADRLSKACQKQVGDIEQTPPVYSAIKIDGKHAYELARKGVAVQIPTRTVRVDRCELVAYQHPNFELLIECGSGTYVRSIGRDIANSLGTEAIMTSLCREAVGVFHASDAITLDQFQVKEPRADVLLPLHLAVHGLPEHTAAPEVCRDLMQGKKVALAIEQDRDELAILDDAGNLRSIVTREFDRWRSVKNF